jgi:ubiquinone/menaquinone biosynthesis C-methylase UbiE
MTPDYYAGIGPGYYDLFSTGLAGDVPFYVAQARAAGSPVLEIACGTGRIAIPIAEAGCEIVGLELSPEMLAQFRAKLSALAPEVRERITLVQGDMRTFELARRFPLIIIPYRAFLHNKTVGDQQATLRRIHAHLQPGGRLVFNVFDPNLSLIVAHSGPLGQALTRTGEFTRPDGHQVVVWEARQYEQTEQIVQVQWIYDELGDDGLVVSRAYANLSLRWVYRYEMEHLLALCGFEVEALYGDFEQGPFVAGQEQVWVARRLD